MKKIGRRLAVAVGVPLAAVAGVLGPDLQQLAADPSGPGARASVQVSLTPADGPSGEDAHTLPGLGMRGEPGPRWIAVPPKADAGAWVRVNGGLWSTEVPHAAGGSVRVVPGSAPAPHEAERVVTVRIAVEDGLAVEGPLFADTVLGTLNDPRGWGHDGSVAFARTDGEADVDVTLASPATTDRLCHPVDTGGRVSCGRVGFAVLNAVNWAKGAQPFLAGGGTVEEYRQYLVNHEVGHVLGNPHVGCPVPGELAPIMLQQTLRLEGCLPNGWPAP